MDKSIPVNTLFLDIGGVMLTNGWGHESRILAADVFNPDLSDMDDRIEDLQMFVDVARDLGIRSIQHNNFLSTSAELASMGLKIG